jgi:hypothetical protein
MRQNPSNIDLIAKNLSISDSEKDYLITAQKGNGLLITEMGRSKFITMASPKAHELLTTNPAEVRKAEAQRKKTKIKIDLERGLFLKNNLTDGEVAYLLCNNYQMYKTRLGERGAVTYYLVKKKGRESLAHAFLCWYIHNALKGKASKIKMNATVNADIEAIINKKKVCFEVETGTLIDRKETEEVTKKFDDIRKQCDQLYIVVSNNRIKGNYLEFAPVINRNEIEKTIENLYNNSGKSIPRNLRDLRPK